MKINQHSKKKCQLTLDDVEVGEVYKNQYGAIVWRVSEDYEVVLKPFDASQWPDLSDNIDDVLFPTDRCTTAYPVEIFGLLKTIDEISTE